jgi:hypothetical protein
MASLITPAATEVIGIVGGGFSGTMVAVHSARMARSQRPAPEGMPLGDDRGPRPTQPSHRTPPPIRPR